MKSSTRNHIFFFTYSFSANVGLKEHYAECCTGSTKSFEYESFVHGGTSCSLNERGNNRFPGRRYRVLSTTRHIHSSVSSAKTHPAANLTTSFTLYNAACSTKQPTSKTSKCNKHRNERSFI